MFILGVAAAEVTVHSENCKYKTDAHDSSEYRVLNSRTCFECGKCRHFVQQAPRFWQWHRPDPRFMLRTCLIHTLEQPVLQTPQVAPWLFCVNGVECTCFMDIGAEFNKLKIKRNVFSKQLKYVSGSCLPAETEAVIKFFVNLLICASSWDILIGMDLLRCFNFKLAHFLIPLKSD